MGNNYTLTLTGVLNDEAVRAKIIQLQELASKSLLNFGGGVTSAGGAAGTTSSLPKVKQTVEEYQAALTAIQPRMQDMVSHFNTFNKALVTTTTDGALLTGATVRYSDGLGKLGIEQVKVNRTATDMSLKVNNTAKEFTNATTASDKFGTQILKDIGKVLQWAVATAAIYGTLKAIKEGISYIGELDKSLTNISIVTGMTREQTSGLAQTYNQLAQQMGVSTKAVADGSLEWFRQGKTVEQTTELMKSSLMMATLGNMTAADATEKLTATLNGFQMGAEESVGVVDRLVALDNAYSTSVNEITTAMQYSAAVANQAGVSFDQLASYITVISSVTRMSAETVGQSFPR
jgi:hypothetical protein